MEIPVVVNADEMEDETFKAHFEKRHMDQMPGLNGFVEPAHPDTVNSYRIFHETIHRLFPLQEDHEHEQ